MGQSGWRLPDELLKRVRVHCAQTGERQNAFVEQALENALSETPVSPAVSEALKSAWDDPALHRQLITDHRKTLPADPDRPRPVARKKPAATGELPKIAPRRWAK